MKRLSVYTNGQLSQRELMFPMQKSYCINTIYINVTTRDVENGGDYNRLFIHVYEIDIFFMNRHMAWSTSSKLWLQIYYWMAEILSKELCKFYNMHNAQFCFPIAAICTMIVDIPDLCVPWTKFDMKSFTGKI